jgi:pimeloyl-ACP methyl ester carboxylesterase
MTKPGLHQNADMKLLGIVYAAALLLGACSSSTSSTRSAVLGSTLPKCADDQRWRCGSVSVPIDRKNPAAGTIKIAFFVQVHIDTNKPALEPIFVSPGGPGASIWADHSFLPQTAWDVRHDTVLIEPRGVGRSGVIVCQELQAGVSNLADLSTASADCGRQLGAAADRYGTGDVALDIEDVRKALGVNSFDFYAASYGTIAEQAYVIRFPNRVHALVLDSAFPAIDPAQSYVLGTGYPVAWIRVLKLICQRAPDCASAYPRPGDLIDWLVKRVASNPIPASIVGAGPTFVDEAAVEALLSSFGPGSYQLQTRALLDAAATLKAGDPGPILQLASNWPLIGVGSDDPAHFSNGDNAAANCNDQNFPWDRADPVAVREKKLAAAYAALPANTFDPFTTAGWAAGNPGPDSCITWPSPNRYEPVVPAGARFPSLPTLIVSGDEDTQAPEEISRTLQTEFPGATFLVVAGAGHDAAAADWTSCGGAAVATFFDTLRVDPAACAIFNG